MRQALVCTRIALLMMVLAASPACAALQGESGTPTPPLESKLVLVEDLGEVCFTTPPGYLNVTGRFRPRGCYSSSGSRPLEQTLSVKVDPDRFRIEFRTSFLIEITPARSFTQDCEGGGMMSFEIGDVEQGVYSIWIGDKRVGKLAVPFAGATDQLCLGED
jgi:hypothetical protein